MKNDYTVIVLLESKPGLENELKQALIKVANKSREETTCIEYHLHQDLENKAKFGLYEKWKCQEDHQKQFSKPYIQEFADKAGDLLAKPYEGLFGVELCSRIPS